MAVFSIPFTIAGNYFYNSSKIEVTGGLAKLKDSSIWNNLEVYYRMEESLWNGTINEVIDSSGNGIHATAYNGANTFPSGKIGRGASFDGVNDYVASTNNIPVSLTGNPDFTISFWLYVPTGAIMTGDPYRHIFSFGAPVINNLVQITNYNVTPNRIYIGWYGAGGQYATNTILYDTWHHIMWRRTGGGKVRDGNELYIDNISEVLIDSGGTLEPNTIAGPFKLQRGVPTSQRFIQCYMDEVCVWSRVLSNDEKNEVYNSGSGAILSRYANDNPTIYKTAPDIDTVGAWNGFTVTEGTVEGSLGYQLSEDGVTWKYWNGSSWIVAVGGQYNTETVVNTNIGDFPTAQNKIYVRSWLISDGSQQVEIDEIQVLYTSNLNPAVSAGSNKSCLDNQSIAPFSDATFSDPDGSIDHAYYKVDGEIDVWTEIPQNGFGSLLEAVQSFQYQFNNIGTLTVRLQVEDNLGATNEDSLIVTVNKYTKTVNVKDVVTGEHVYFFVIDPGDGEAAFQTSSPFEYAWEYGSYDLVIEKDYFYRKEEIISVQNEDEVTIYLQASSFLNECKASVGLKTEADELSIITWLQQGGQVVLNPTSCTVRLYDEDHTLVYTSTSTSAEASGDFDFKKSPSGLANEGVYHLYITIVASGVSFESLIPLGLIERKVISFEGAIHVNIDEGSSGTDFPLGTPEYPVDNCDDAKTIADIHNLREFLIVGDAIGVGADVTGYIFKGKSAHVASITFSGLCNTTNTSFEDIDINGELNGDCHIHHCHINNVSGLAGHIHSASIFGPIILGGDTIIGESLLGDVDKEYASISCQGNKLKIYRSSGNILLKDKTDSGITEIGLTDGFVKVDSSCTNGSIVISGNCSVEDNSGSNCTVVRSLIQDIHDESLGEWTLNPDAKTITLYRLDGSILTIMDLNDTNLTLPSFVGRTPR